MGSMPPRPFTPDALLSVLHGFPPAPRYWVAYSGGLDSGALLHALARGRDRLPGELRAVHVNHGLHADAGRWAARCEGVCAGLGVPFELRVVSAAEGAAGAGPEAAARDARYAALAAVLGRGDALLTGHNQDDQAETVLLHLLRGSGPEGLAGMPARRPLGGGWLLRPLLAWRRVALEAFARAEALDWIDDPSNREDRFDRNFLRNAVMPLLHLRWPAVSTVLARAAGHQGDASRCLEALARDDLRRARGEAPGTLSVSALRELPEPRRRAVVRAWLRGLGLPSPAAAHLDRVLRDAVDARPDATPCVAWPGAEVRRHRDTLMARLPARAGAPVTAWRWSLGEVIRLPGGVLDAQPGTGRGVSVDRVGAGEVTVRLRRGGERCRLPGRGHRHALKKLLQAERVPTWARESLPLVYVDGELAAVAGLWICEPFAAGPGEAGWMIRWRPDRGVASGEWSAGE
jgi:tRNA(Ile)-lysidine synthase